MSNPQRRNERERRRVQHLNSTLQKLKNKIPDEWKSQNMSKIDILRKASAYIRLLRSILSVDTGQVIQTGNYKSDTWGNNHIRGHNPIQRRLASDSNTVPEYTEYIQQLEMESLFRSKNYKNGTMMEKTQNMDHVENTIFTQNFSVSDKEAMFSDIYSIIF